MRIHKLGKSHGLTDTLAASCDVWETLNTGVSLSCYLLVKYKEYTQLVEKDIDPLDYIDDESFFLDYLSVSLLKKQKFLKTSYDTRMEAIKKFISAEKSCKETNERFRRHEFGPDVTSILFRMQRLIASSLGRVPSLSDLDFRFGPGASLGVRRLTSVYDKVLADLECTHVFQPLLSDFLGEFPGWITEDIASVKLVNGSELTFVPKSAKTDRPICIEPLLNGLFQKGVGSHIRNRLAREGINLRDQKVNQELARVAVRDNLATVDFSSASDTISYGLVLDLLPWDWFELLDYGRSPSYFFEGRWYPFHKFTSMGNAYTFELETLIFWALAKAIADEADVTLTPGINFHVYGDDVIIPCELYERFKEVSMILGFTVNDQKSFSSGPFRESCGADFFESSSVRPIFIKDSLRELTQWYWFYNQLWRISQRPWISYETRRRLDICRHRVLRRIPHNSRTYGPDGYGDCWLVGEFDQSRPRLHRSYDAFVVLAVLFSPFKRRPSEYPMAFALYRAMDIKPFSVLSGDESQVPFDGIPSSRGVFRKGHILVPNGTWHRTA